jgi:hypothetical protein
MKKSIQQGTVMFRVAKPPGATVSCSLVPPVPGQLTEKLPVLTEGAAAK